MEVLFDHQIFTLQKYGGISRYFCELMNQFSFMPDIRFNLGIRHSYNENILIRNNLDKYWSAKCDILCNSQLFSVLQRNFGVDLLRLMRINQSESIRLLKKTEYDLFHPTYYNPYFLKYIVKKPYVLTVHDMIHERYPESFPERDPVKKWKKKLIEDADSIISVSENTKKDILNFYDIDESKINIVYHGNPLERTTTSQFSDSRLIDRKSCCEYLLFVGNRSGYKNFQFFINSIAGYLNNKHMHLLCAGGGSFTSDELHMFQKLNLIKRIHFVDINDSNLSELYKNARAFIFPSLYEGFGLPVLEAFSCRCPVILSNSSSLPEVGGNAACYIDPNHSDSIVQGVESVLSDDNYKKELINRGLQRLKLFSWEKTAYNTKNVYNNLL